MLILENEIAKKTEIISSIFHILKPYQMGAILTKKIYFKWLKCQTEEKTNLLNDAKHKN